MQTFSSASPKDVRTALLSFGPTLEMQQNSMTGIYDVVTKRANLVSNCVDCEVGIQPLNQDCEIKNGVWMQASQLTKTLTAPVNGGKACQFDTTVQYIGCEKNKDCIIEFKSSDAGCINGTRQYRYTIKAPSSANGKSCVQAILDLLPSNLKNLATIDVDYSGNQATASISCNECIIDYVIDQTVNNGQCTLKNGKYTITKVGKIIKEASGGLECPTGPTTIFGKKIEEVCVYNQNCIVDSTVVSDTCDDVLGVRKIIHKIKQPSLGNGSSCEDMSNNFGVDKYPLNKSINYDKTNSTVEVTIDCPILKDCNINWDSKKNYVDNKKGLSVDIYDINNEEQGRGKNCEKITLDKYEGKLLYSQVDNGKMYVYNEYTPPKSNLIVYIGIILLIFIVVIVMIIRK